MTFPSEMADDNVIRASFVLDVKDGVGTSVNNGGLWKGTRYIGSFDGLVGFAHNVLGEDREGVDALLDDLSQALHDQYKVPLPELPEETEPIAEEENDG